MGTTYTNIEQLLISESNRIGDDIYRKTVDTSPWLKLVKQDAWPDEMGTSVSVLVYERSLPYNSSGNLKVNWTNIGQNGGAYGGTLSYDGSGADSSQSGNANSFPASGGTIEFGQTLRTYGLQHAAMESPNLSLNDLRFPMKRKEQLSNIMQIMTESTTEVWIQRYRDQYVDQAENKLLATSSTNITGLTNADTSIAGTIRVLSTGVDTRTTGFATTTNAHGAGAAAGVAGASVTQLTQTILDRVYMDLLRNGAGADAYDRVNGAPVFLAIMSPETSDSLIRANADIRQDFRWSDRVSELLAPLGIQRSYRNFHHLVDAFVPRYDLVSNAWVRVYPFVRSANNSPNTSRQGFKYELNPAYLAAGYEDTIIFVPDVFTSLVPKPLSIGEGIEFNAQNYRGEFTWRNILDRETNPDGTLGYFRAVFSNGAKPIFPHKGYVIRHARNVIV
ncbi:MAG: hypothetical protein EBU96_01230 [Actinobacteria bacterium]|nr:hypothetical protein [Actinomycetota bacterium]